MKIINKLYTLLIAAILMVAVSCTETETQAVFEGRFVSFETATSAVLESSADPLDLTITMAGPLLSSDLTIEDEVDVTTGSNGDFTLSNTTGSLTIPAGEVSTTISLTPVDNFDADGNKEVVITITSASEELTLGLPGPAENNKSVVVTINDDDCPFNIDFFSGTYDVNEDNGAFLYEATVTKVDATTISVTNIWDSGMTVEVSLDATDPANLRAYILPQNTGVVLCCGTPAWVTSRPDPDASASAPAMAGLPDGSFKTCDGGIEFDFYVYVPSLGTFNGGAPVNAVYSKQ